MEVVAMKLRYTVAITMFILALILYTTVVQAGPWSALGSGYAVTTDYQGMLVFVPENVTATAGTTEHPEANGDLGGRVPQFPDVTQVRFRWMPPNGSGVPEWLTGLITLEDSGENYTDKDGEFWDIYTANDTQTIEVIGDWGVQAWFYDENGTLRNQTGIEKIRATSFEAIPDVPYGTIAAFLAMFGALTIFAIKKKRIPLIRRPL